MTVTSQKESDGISAAGKSAAIILREMCSFASPGISTLELDAFGLRLMKELGAVSAPMKFYNFPKATCISVNHEAAHGIPSAKNILREGDLLNIDVSLEQNGYVADNGCSLIVGRDIHHLAPLVQCSKEALQLAVQQCVHGEKIRTIGKIIFEHAKKNNFRVIKNLTGHGVGKSLHEFPHEIACYEDKQNTNKFKKDLVVAVETFISTKAEYVQTESDGWTLSTPDGSFVAQHEHTILITEGEPIILTYENGIENIL
ncbi:MAG: type I methionyl aminopeptidase [Bacteroidetes bacterium]|nr:type I methionyl aminopeptidase [Bacteroidota bacterium]